MRNFLIFIVAVIVLGCLLYWSRYELEYGVTKLGVFERTQVLKRDRWKWEGAATELQYYEVCRRPDELCWRRSPDNSFWLIDRPSYDSPYFAIIANNRNGEIVENEFRIFETSRGEELKCKGCDLSDFVRSERESVIHLTGRLIFLQTMLKREGEKVLQRMRLLEINGDGIVSHHLQDVPRSTSGYGVTIARTNSELGATAWITCSEEACSLREYWVDSKRRTERVVQCDSAPNAKLDVRVEDGRFVPVCTGGEKAKSGRS